MIFSDFPGVLSFFQVFQVEWELWFTQQILKHFRVPGQYRENGAILVPLSILSDKIVFPVESGGFPVCLS